jgi:hypothetical protein
LRILIGVILLVRSLGAFGKGLARQQMNQAVRACIPSADPVSSVFLIQTLRYTRLDDKEVLKEERTAGCNSVRLRVSASFNCSWKQEEDYQCFKGSPTPPGTPLSGFCFIDLSGRLRHHPFL